MAFVTSSTPSPDGKLAHSIADVVARTGIGRSTIYSEIHAGRIRTRKVGSRTIILDSDLRAYLDALPATRATEAA